MAHLDENSVREALRGVKYPGFSRDIVSFGLVKEVKISGGNVAVSLALTTNDSKIVREVHDNAETVISALPGVNRVQVGVEVQSPAQAVGGIGPTQIEGVRHVIAVASGKGGVGKSTVAANLAAALAATGTKVGLCDCDLYGPSVALMFGGPERVTADENDNIFPVERYGIKLMSMGFLLEDGSPAVLRGPMVTRYTQQFLRQVLWAPLDYLILDLPPGTGDIQLTIVQSIALTGSVIVTTPQEVALIDARKAVGMFGKTNVPVLGLIENMSYFLCPDNGKRYDIFGAGGGEREAARLRVPLLGELPIEIAVRESGDLGRPIVCGAPEDPVSKEFLRIAGSLRQMVEKAVPA